MPVLTYRPSHSGAFDLYDGDVPVMRLYRVAGYWEACLRVAGSGMVGKGENREQALRDCLHENLLDLASRSGVVGALARQAEKGIEFAADTDHA